MSEEFTCVICGGAYDKAWDDEDAEAELISTFGAVPLDECAVVCDDCYLILNAVHPFREYPKANGSTTAINTDP